VPADKDITGNTATHPSAAVLHPVSRYINQFQATGPVLVFGIVGVGANGVPVYANSNDEFQASFGIGPGCTGPTADAVPPVRIRAVLDELGPAGSQAAFSICGDDYAPGLAQIAAAIVARI
jgi:hypothetical protein